MTSKDAHTSIPGKCDYVTFHGKETLKMSLRRLFWVRRWTQSHESLKVEEKGKRVVQRDETGGEAPEIQSRRQTWPTICSLWRWRKRPWLKEWRWRQEGKNDPLPRKQESRCYNGKKNLPTTWISKTSLQKGTLYCWHLCFSSSIPELVLCCCCYKLPQS